MSGGLDILIVGIAGENLENIASGDKLRDLFGAEELDADAYYDSFCALINDPKTENPRVFYVAGEHMVGSIMGAGLGYVIFCGDVNLNPSKIDERVFERIDELKKKFAIEIGEKGVNIPEQDIGVYSLNVYDT